MAKTRSMSRNGNHDDDDDASSRKRKRIKSCDHDGAAPWLELNHDVLFLVMMQLGVVDFLAFSGVCKSWRSFAHSNRNMFMTSRSPMMIWIKDRPYKKECYLKDFEGRKFKTLLPHSASRSYVGLTCGYLVFYSKKTHDFWLVNPITRDELHFPSFPGSACCSSIKAILVFSPSISGWVFVVVCKKYCQKIWFSIVGKGAWNHDLSSNSQIVDLLAFKGRIFVLTSLSIGVQLHLGLSEMRLNPVSLLEIENYPKSGSGFLHDMEFVRAGEQLCWLNWIPQNHLSDVQELDFKKLDWESLKGKTIREYAIFLTSLNYSAAIKPQTWADSQLLQFRRYFGTEESQKGSFYFAKMWYFPHDCLNVILKDE